MRRESLSSKFASRWQPRHGWRGWLESSAALRAYFRGAEYPMGHVEATWQALRMAWRWPA